MMNRPTGLSVCLVCSQPLHDEFCDSEQCLGWGQHTIWQHVHVHVQCGLLSLRCRCMHFGSLELAYLQPQPMRCLFCS